MPELRRTLNIIGCGKLGKALGRLWMRSGVFAPQDLLNRSADSAAGAAAFVGAGRAIDGYAALRPADAHLIAVPDDRIAACCAQLADTGILNAGDIVFHCSGALGSDVLAPAAQRGALVASAHPVRSFAEPEQAVRDFAGTFCGMEGDAAAVAALEAAFAAVGARTVRIDARSKTVYHAAAVFASNYLVTLLDVALDAYAKAGVPRETALEMMAPLVRGTVDNVFRAGTVDALTGPVARGDVATVVRQYRAVRDWDRQRGALYRQLAKLTAGLAARKGKD